MRALENPRPCNNRPPAWRIWPGKYPTQIVYKQGVCAEDLKAQKGTQRVSCVANATTSMVMICSVTVIVISPYPLLRTNAL